MDSNEKIENKIKDVLGGLEMQPAYSSFDAVLSKMARKRRRRIFYVFFPIGLFLATILMFRLNVEKAGMVNRLSVGHTKKQNRVDRQAEKKDHSDQVTKSQFSPGVNNARPEIISRDNPVIRSGNIKRSINNIENEFTTGDQRSYKVKKSLPDPGETETLYSYLPPITVVLPYDVPQKEVEPLITANSQTDSLSSGKKEIQRFKYYAGVSYNPQITGFHILENKHRDPSYDNISSSYAGNYRATKKDEQTFRLSQAFGIKFGIIVEEKWWFLTGAGYQRFTESVTKVTSTVPGVHPSSAPFTVGLNEKTEPNTFKYFMYSLEAGRIKVVKPLIKLRAGAGIQYNKLTDSDFPFKSNPSSEQMAFNKNIFIFHATGGVVYNLTERTQFHLCSKIFYSGNSVFEKSFVVRQHAFGAGLEALLLFQIH